MSTKSAGATGPKTTVKALAEAYIHHNEVADFGKLPEHAKLAVFQHTPKEFILERQIGKQSVKYIPHTYAKKVLNFVFNFRVDNEVEKEEVFSYKEKYPDYRDPKCQQGNNGRVVPVWKERTVTEAEVTMKFLFTCADGHKIVRTVKATHKQYPNPALCQKDVLKGAYSKAWTAAAATFGVGLELEKSPEEDEAAVVEVVAEDVKPPDYEDGLDY